MIHFHYIIKPDMANNYDFMFKFIIIGDSSTSTPISGVGKSCLLLRFTEGRFKTDHEPTLGVEFGSRNINVDNMSIKIQIWDTVHSFSLRQDKSLSSLSRGPTTKALSQPFWFSTSPNEIALRISTNGSSKSKIILTIKFKPWSLETNTILKISSI